MRIVEKILMLMPGQEMRHPYMNAVRSQQEEMQRLLQTPSLMTESEKAMKYNQMMNGIIAYKNKL